jgi:hypothetical protein
LHGRQRYKAVLEEAAVGGPAIRFLDLLSAQPKRGDRRDTRSAASQDAQRNKLVERWRDRVVMVVTAVLVRSAVSRFEQEIQKRKGNKQRGR